MWARVMDEAKLADVTPHDLRRTFMTTCTELGYPLAIGDALLGHSLGKIRDTYVNLGSEGIMATASQETADWIAAAMAGKKVKLGVKVAKETQAGTAS
jgi:integrase